MKVHTIMASSSIANLAVEKVFIDKTQAQDAFMHERDMMARTIGDTEPEESTFRGADQWSYTPDDGTTDDGDDYENMEVRLQFDIDVTPPPAVDGNEGRRTRSMALLAFYMDVLCGSTYKLEGDNERRQLASFDLLGDFLHGVKAIGEDPYYAAERAIELFDGDLEDEPEDSLTTLK